jgi:hypothetical protein
MPAAFTGDIQPSLLWRRSGNTLARYGAVTLCRTPFQEISRVIVFRCDRSEHHIAREGFGLDCVVFTRGY